MKQDEELLVMGKIDRILSGLTTSERARVLAWLTDRHKDAEREAAKGNPFESDDSHDLLPVA